MEENIQQEETARGFSRRGFIKGASLAALGAVGAAAMSGCSSNESPSSAAGTPAETKATAAVDSDSIWALEEVGEPTETLSADVVVVGGGGTGMAAAIQAQELGLKTILLEKAGVLGGSYVATEGMYGVESHWQKEAGETTTVGEAVRKCLNYHHFIPSPKLYKNFFSQTADTIEWLEDHGCQFEAVVAYNGNLAWHVYHYDESASSPGAYFTNSLAEATEACGAEILTSTPVKQILVEDGKATGVIAEKSDGTIVKVEAPVVLLASGGYASNMDFLHAVSTYTVNENLQSLGGAGRDGDGMKMAKAVGADLAEGYGTVMWCGPCAIGASWASDAYSASVQPTLWVNQDGERYINEDLWIGNFAAGGIAARNQKKTYVMFTESDLAAWEANGPYGTVFTFGTPGVAMSEARAQLEKLDSVHQADSIAELAKSVGIEVEALEETVSTYNALCAAGVDDDFGKAKEFLYPIEEGPFYILEVADGFYTTVGGVKISPDTEVIDTEGQVIGGLYAGGCDAGGLYGDSYDVECAPGSQASWAVNSGRLAMKHAAEYLNA